MSDADAHIGWQPTGRGLAWAAVGGLLASILIGIPAALLSLLRSTAAALAGSDSLAVGWAVHLVAGVLAALVYGAFVSARRLGTGAAYGAAYGAIVGVVLVWFGANVLLDRFPLLAPIAIFQVVGHVVWGTLLGLIHAWGLKPSPGEAHARPSRTPGGPS